jgi:small basic protein
MRGWTILIGALLVGVVLGVVGTLKIPSWAEPYFHARFSQPTHTVEGQVTKKQREADRVLLRVQVNHALLLATFTKKVPEIDLLVQEGDTVTLGLPHDRPFVEDPVIEAVHHPTATPASTPPASGVR